MVGVGPQEGYAYPLGRAARLIIPALTRSSRALSKGRISKLVKLAGQPKGTRLVGRTLGSMKLPREVLEDAYLRIAVAQGRISPQKAQRWFINLRNTPGFRSTLSKTIGHSAAKTKGHLNELSIASHSSARGFKVLGIGQGFRDPAKTALTDIDLLLSRKGRRFIIEAKDYAPSTRLKMDQIRADLLTLKQAQKADGQSIAVFSCTHRPESALDLSLLKAETKKLGIQLLFGPPASQAEQLKLLGDIL